MESGVPCDVWDMGAPQSCGFSFTLGSIEEFLAAYRSVWWRYKGSSQEYQGTFSAQEAFIGREWLALLRSLAAMGGKSLWVNNPVSTAACNLKIRNLAIARTYGFETPETIVTNDPDRFDEFVRQHSHVVYKALTYYYEEPNIGVFTSVVSRDASEECAVNIRVAPVQLQERVEKEYELRVTVVGSDLFPVRIDSQAREATRVDWRRGQMCPEMYSPGVLPQSVEDMIRGIQDNLGLQYGAYDLIVKPDGTHVFLEVNPGGQWLWLEHATDVGISRAVAQLLEKGLLEKGGEQEDSQHSAVKSS